MLEKNMLEQYWVQIETLENEEVIPFVKGQGLDDQETFQLFSMIQRKLYQAHGKSSTLEEYGRFILKIIDTYRQKANSSDESEAHLHYANVMLYNLSADMAECWPGESFVKTKGCFEIGLQAAQDCIVLREILKKDNASFAMGFWAKGMHQLSLHQFSESLESFQMAFSLSVKSNEINSVLELSQDHSFSEILYSGYFGIASVVNNVAEGEMIYDQAINLFKKQVQDEKKKDDASFGIEQLEYVKNKFINNSTKN